MHPLPIAPQPVSQDGLDEIIAWQVAMSQSLAVSRAKTLCLRAERFFEKAAECGVAHISFETLHSIEVSLVNLGGPHLPPVSAKEADISRKLDARWVEGAFSKLLHDSNQVGAELREAGVTLGFGARQLGNEPIEPATGFELLCEKLLGQDLHAEWKAQREAHELALAVGSSAPSKPSQPRL